MLAHVRLGTKYMFDVDTHFGFGLVGRFLCVSQALLLGFGAVRSVGIHRPLAASLVFGMVEQSVERLAVVIT